MQKDPSDSSSGHSPPSDTKRKIRAEETNPAPWVQYASKLRLIGESLLDTTPSELNDLDFVKYEDFINAIYTDAVKKKKDKAIQKRLLSALGVITRYAAETKKKGHISKGEVFVKKIKPLGQELIDLSKIIERYRD